jgi:predicted nucleic acid-binding protein
MIFVDTNVFSELTKPRAEDRVVDWLHAHRNETLLSTLVVADLRVGIRTTRGPDNRALLGRWLDRLIERHEERTVPFDLADANHWGGMAGAMIVTGGRSGWIDSMVAAQALRRGLAVATRNVHDFTQTGVTLINPWND